MLFLLALCFEISLYNGFLICYDCTEQERVCQ